METLRACDSIISSSQGRGVAICYVHLLLTGSEPLTYSNYIFTQFDNRRITENGKIHQVFG
jgi:hypothetical protein